MKVWNSEPSHRKPMSISNKQAPCERVNDLFGIKLVQSRISYAIRNNKVYHGFTFKLTENN